MELSSQGDNQELKPAGFYSGQLSSQGSDKLALLLQHNNDHLNWPQYDVHKPLKNIGFQTIHWIVISATAATYELWIVP